MKKLRSRSKLWLIRIRIGDPAPNTMYCIWFHNTDRKKLFTTAPQSNGETWQMLSFCKYCIVWYRNNILCKDLPNHFLAWEKEYCGTWSHDVSVRVKMSYAISPHKQEASNESFQFDSRNIFQQVKQQPRKRNENLCCCYGRRKCILYNRNLTNTA